MNLQTRVKNILIQPASEWTVIAAEPTDVMGLYRNYILILAAIPAVSLFVGLAVFGAPYIGRLAMGGALSGAITAYVRTLISVLIAAVIIEKLAATFGASGTTAQALKLVAYACTPVWLAGVFFLIWFLSAPASLIAAIYAVYLFYLGVAPVMKTPADKVIPYMLVSAIAIIVVWVVLGLLMAAMGFISGGYGSMF
jgi:hypothetical protein